MRIGHIDGKGVIYNDLGEPILGHGESMLSVVRNDQLDVSEGSSILNMKVLFGSTAERGRLFLTDRRMIFLGTPDAALAAKYDAYPLGMADAIAKGYKATSLRKRGALEYCEIEYGEVEGFWVKKSAYGVLFLDSPRDGTRKAVMYRRGPDDNKFLVLRSMLKGRLPLTEPEDRKGNFLLGKRRPFLGKKK